MSDPYSRFYWRFAEEYPDIYNDDRCFAWWLRLLYQAEAAYPVQPLLPRRLPAAVLVRLAEPGLIIPTAGDRYTVKGLEAERLRRSEHARKAAKDRWDAPSMPPASGGHSAGNAPSNAQPMPRQRQETENETKSLSREIPSRADLAALHVRGWKVSSKQQRVLDEIAGRHDIAGHGWAAAIIHTLPDEADWYRVVVDQDTAWQRNRRADIDRAEAAWKADKDADRARSEEVMRRLA